MQNLISVRIYFFVNIDFGMMHTKINKNIVILSNDFLSYAGINFLIACPKRIRMRYLEDQLNVHVSSCNKPEGCSEG